MNKNLEASLIRAYRAGAAYAQAQYDESPTGLFVNAILYPVEPTPEHLFRPGDTATLIGLETFPQYNGDTVTIEAVRRSGVFGRCYYVKGRINLDLNWVYEYRLEKPAV